MVGRHCAVNGETCAQGEAHRSQSLHSTVAAIAAKSADSKATPRKGRQEGGCVKSSNRQSISYVSPVYRHGGTKQGTETGSWVEASIWTEHMLAALENGVKGGKCLLRWAWAFHHERSLCAGEPTTMLKPPTGEPCAGEPHARFGGRGGTYPFPTPICKDPTVKDLTRLV